MQSSALRVCARNLACTSASCLANAASGISAGYQAYLGLVEMKEGKRRRNYYVIENPLGATTGIHFFIPR